MSAAPAEDERPLPRTADRERLLDLLLERSQGTLDANGAAEIELLLTEHPDLDPGEIEAVLAATHVALLDASEPLPAELALRLEEQARAFARSRAPVGLPSPAERRARLVASGHALEATWQPTEDELGRGVRGDVVWDGARQEGYLRFVDLAPNDAARHQYQLWIFDASRPSETPVDGGVFDVPAGAHEVVVAIDAKLPVHGPTLFAVTLERPGGVVVSSREHLLLTAAVS